MNPYDNPTVVATGYTGNLPATNEVPVDMHAKTYKAFPELTPITSMLTKIADSQPARQIRIDHMEPQKIPTAVVVSADLASNGTALTVISGGVTLVKDTVLFNPRTWDYASVDSNPSSNSVTITRGVAGSTAAQWYANDILHVLPPKVAEDDETFRTSSVADENYYNIVQLVKLQYSLSRLMNQTTTIHGGPGAKREQLKQQKYYEFREKWEKLIYFGGRSSVTSSGVHTGMMGGLVHFLRNGTLFKDFGGFFTESGFRKSLGNYKDQNPESTNVTFYCGGHYMDLIDSWAGDKMRLSPDSETFGMDIWYYKSRGLRVNLVPLPLLVDEVTKGWGFLLDLDRIGLKHMDPAKFIPEAKNIGESEKIIDTYRVATSMFLANESRHMMLIGAR